MWIKSISLKVHVPVLLSNFNVSTELKKNNKLLLESLLLETYAACASLKTICRWGWYMRNKLCSLHGLHEILQALHKTLNSLHETIHTIRFKSTRFTWNGLHALKTVFRLSIFGLISQCTSHLCCIFIIFFKQGFKKI